MPVHCSIEIPRLGKKEFGEVSYRVMEHIFDIHRDFGRLFDERIYKQELALRLHGLRLEVPVDVSHGTFTKRYFLDVLTAEGALFEFKTVEELSRRHFAQLLHYLLLLDLAHGKLVNLRPTEVKHEFVNAALTAADRRQFTLDRHEFDKASPGAAMIEEILVPLLDDLGTGLELALYEEAVTHFLGGESVVEQDVNVMSDRGVVLGVQRMRICASGAAFKLTTFAEPSPAFREHCQRLLQHLPIEAIQWVNIASHRVTFSTLKRQADSASAKFKKQSSQASASFFLP
jgi:GxxExxY protein